MKLKTVLINPWICDFAAANLWSRPLGLLRVAECLSALDLELSFIDCMDVVKQGKFGTGKYSKEIIAKPDCIKSVPRLFGRYGIPVEEFKDTLAAHAPFDLVFMTSIMSYWYPGVQQAIAIIRESYGNVPVVLGGIYATLWNEHASATSGADFIYRGQAGEQLKFVFDTFGFRVKKKTTTKGALPQTRQCPEVPHDKHGLQKGFSFAPVLTGAGCPFRCSYCASHLLHKGFVQRDPLKVVEEIKELHTIGIRDFAFYDDALLANADSHIKVVLKEVIRHKLQARFHCPNGLHARFIDNELAFLMKRSGFTTLRLSLETINRQRQDLTGGKVTSRELAQAVESLKKSGFTKEQLGVYMMYGLPGQGPAEVTDGMAFLKGLDVRINLTEFSPIPGTHAWSELLDRGVIHKNIDPLLTNNTVFSYLYSGFEATEIQRLKLEAKHYNSLPGKQNG